MLVLGAEKRSTIGSAVLIHLGMKIIPLFALFIQHVLRKQNSHGRLDSTYQAGRSYSARIRQKHTMARIPSIHKGSRRGSASKRFFQTRRKGAN